ncbi:D-alanyl-D-alanine carboxypeptidase family protein [Anaerocolumna xylanovorans]|uniref:D-alanyl-D-alanine carboxypeptidase n=1 Tax=Anaerocolumna xylanovorans DSM 12503 TaxID=1121345 RepID=A0A1M7YJE3_9FIRM|nr:D-alanyl-D-alanine carboxypeptidase [Anaerocolumna xylanovorans]SHO52734.1 D-alanyl-D-alanine carboxypeptidase [Anaerocolumna xylanovorans DSM 12503]
MKKISNVIIILLCFTVFIHNLFYAIPLIGNNIYEVRAVYAKADDNLPLISDGGSVDYMSYIPAMKCSEEVKEALSVSNPEISVDAKAAVLVDAEDGKVLYHKNALEPIFPASTAKLLTALVVLDWCKTSEMVKVGKEVSMIPYDSSRAGLRAGDKLKVYNLMEAMLLPSGNDAAYALAVYTGRKSLKDNKADEMAAIREFTRLMNDKARRLGAENSCFISPDGYDAIGQYSTAYDMAKIGLKAIKSETITKIAKERTATIKMVNGRALPLWNTNALINKDSMWYDSHVIGLKTGTTGLAGRCLISAARTDSGLVLSVIMNSTSEGRWRDSLKLIKYGRKVMSANK